MRALSLWLGLGASLGGTVPACAQGEADLLAALRDTPPAIAAEDRQAARPAQALRWHLDTDLTVHDRRPVLPAAPDPAARATAGLRLSVEGGVALGPATTFRLNGALTLRREAGDGGQWSQATRFDLREAFWLHQSGAVTLELGRINIRNGVAQGFNPVDFFRVQDPDLRPDLDPSEARRNRLGVMAARLGYLWGSGAVSLAYVPELTGGDALLQDRAVWGLNLAATNPTERFLVSLTQELAEGVSPELFVLVEPGTVTTGLAASIPLGDRWLIQGEATRGKGLSVMDAALADWRAAGTLAAPIAAEYGAGEGRHRIDRAVLGVSYATASNLTATLEYHYNGAGFDAADEERYFALARQVAGSQAASAQLAAVPLQAAFAQEPLSRSALWLRLVQTDPMPGLTLSALGAASLIDGSGAVQIGADYDLANGVTIRARAGGNFGGQATEYGARSSRSFGSVGVTWHF